MAWTRNISLFTQGSSEASMKHQPDWYICGSQCRTIEIRANIGIKLFPLGKGIAKYRSKQCGPRTDVGIKRAGGIIESTRRKTMREERGICKEITRERKERGGEVKDHVCKPRIALHSFSPLTISSGSSENSISSSKSAKNAGRW